jgi:hypothetical protein
MVRRTVAGIILGAVVVAAAAVVAQASKTHLETPLPSIGQTGN